MAGFLDYAKKYAVNENDAVSTFLVALSKQQAALEKGEFNRRSWIKKEAENYSVKLGKIEGTYLIPNIGETREFLNLAADSARTDDDFKAAIEKAYGARVEEPVKSRRGRKPKGGEVGNG